MRKASILVVPALLTVALFAGCGGGDDSSSTAAALTKTEFVKQGNAICQKGNQQIEAAIKKAFGNQQPSKQQVTNFVTETVIPINEQVVSDLEALPAPQGDEDTVQAIFDAVDQGVAKVKANPQLASQGNDAGGAFTEANKLAKDYGLTVCAS